MYLPVKNVGGVPIIDHLPNPSSDDRIMQLTRKLQQKFMLS
jgi:hypothetical protein